MIKNVVIRLRHVIALVIVICLFAITFLGGDDGDQHVRHYVGDRDCIETITVIPCELPIPNKFVLIMSCNTRHMSASYVHSMFFGCYIQCNCSKKKEYTDE